MKTSIHWLRDFVDIQVSAETLAEELSLSGLEVDSVEAAAGEFAGVVVAEILETRRHPDADRLSICRISTGKDELEIVCGAPNARAGIRVPFAPVGTKLPGGLDIRAAKIRGVRSEGMLCSARELGLAEESSGLLELDGRAVAGTDLREHLALDDFVLDVDLTPNRGDCFSVLGIAREIAARRGLEPLEESIDCIEPDHEQSFPVELADTRACPRFAARVISGLATGTRSPDWLRERLRRAGLRPIHPVVDVTNYVMLEYGQPLHAYRLDRLQGAIEVRMAQAGESLTLLNAAECKLDADTLVIADQSGPIGLAGIMGGTSTAVDGETVAILLESAYFAPKAIQGRARRYGLHTDASVRFERGVDPGGQERAIERASALLREIAGGQVGPLLLAEDPSHVPERLPIVLRSARIAARLGIELADEEIEQLLERLGLTVERNSGGWQVTPPSFRFDLAIEEDLIEEVGRLVGYDRIPVAPGRAEVRLGLAPESVVDQDRLEDLLVARGYSETIHFGFTSSVMQTMLTGKDPELRLRNPISQDLDVLRSSLWPGLLGTARLNFSHQASRCRLFELGTVFGADGGRVQESRLLAGLAAGARHPLHWDEAAAAIDFYDVKADLDALLAVWRRDAEFAYRRETHPALNPSRTAALYCDDRRIGWIGELHPRIETALEFRQKTVLFELDLAALGMAHLARFQSFSRLPSVRRDLAVIVDEAVAAADLTKVVRDTLGPTLKQLEIFDLYRGKGVDSGRKSIGIGLILQDASRTLTDEETDDMINKVVRRLEHELGARIRT